MKKLVPSTPCHAQIIFRRVLSTNKVERQTVRYGAVKDAINIALAKYNTEADPVQSIDVKITITGDRNR